MDIAHVKECVMMHIDHTADWRMEKFREYPEDDRNEVAAKELYRLSLELSELPEKHPQLVRLAELWEQCSDFSRINEFESETLGGIGFRAGYGSIHEYLRDLIECFQEHDDADEAEHRDRVEAFIDEGKFSAEEYSTFEKVRNVLLRLDMDPDEWAREFLKTHPEISSELSNS